MDPTIQSFKPGGKNAETKVSATSAEVAPPTAL
jgi:hypothetical protein